MNWFDTTGLTSLAKTALKEAQKTIDKALDIQDESGEEADEQSQPQTTTKSSPGHTNTPQKDNVDFFASWGLTMSAESTQEAPIKEQPVVTESPSKSTSQSLWGSFAGSFFEQPKQDDGTIVRPPKAKSMNVISDTKYDSQDDLFSKSQLIMSDTEAVDHRITKSLKDDISLANERRDSSKSNILSLVSSRNSSDSVEVLSQSLKTTPDSEASVHSISHSSSTGLKHNSESVEILPDSLVSPSSIECLGFDSYYSGKNSSSSSMCVSPEDISDKKLIPLGDQAERAETADSVSLVADDDEDTMSYNSISECTAPTVLDTDDKPASPYPKLLKVDISRKAIEKEFIHLEQAIVPQRMQISENSSNDGSWSDRTLNADSDSITLESNMEEQKREQEDIFIDKLSDSSSFYNVNVGNEMLRSESSSFINVEKQQCNDSSSGSSHKEGSVKERTSPISSDSKSDLVKIGSDRTSGHTSGDELETATSSDIEIIPSPNGDGHGFRNSPAKYTFKQSKFDGSTSPNLVDLVLGKSLATKIRGHNRELSEASIQSNTSDESQGSENERLMRRLCEMTEILEARENRLMEVSRSNAELAESNSELKSQVESLMVKHESSDISTITEDYTQRMSALEKKFQQAIREKDQLRKQLDTLKSESSSRKNSSGLEISLKEKDEVIAQLQEEGEKLARQQLQHSNIIKKLRAKEKDNEQVIKSLRDKIAEQTTELDRLKRSIAAKEELEVNQIEAVYRLTTTNKKMETELMEVKSLLDDTTHKLDSTRTSLESARRELNDVQRDRAELARRASQQADEHERRRRADLELERLRAELQQLRRDTVNEEKKWVQRSEALRSELREARDALAALEGAPPADSGAAAVLAQLAHLQHHALTRDHAHAHHTAQLRAQLAEVERSLATAQERERVCREESSALQSRLSDVDDLLEATRRDLKTLSEREHRHLITIERLENELASKNVELSGLHMEHTSQVTELQERLSEVEQQLEHERNLLDTEKKRNAILQEQVAYRGDVSPPHSVTSEALSASLWHSEEGRGSPPALCAEDALTRRAGELRALQQQRDSLLADRAALTSHLAKLQAALDDQQVRATVYSCSTARLAPGRPRRAHLAPRQAAGRAGRPAGTCHCIQLQHSATRSWPTAPRSPRTSPSCRPRWTTSRYVPLYTAAAQRDSLLADRAALTSHLAKLQAALDDQQVRATVYSCSTARLAPGRPRRAHLAPRQAAGRAGRPAGTCHCIQLQHSATRSWPTAPRSPRTSPSCRPRWTTSRYVPLYTAAAQRDSLLADRAALTSHLAKLQAALDDQQVRATVYSCSTARLAPGRPRRAHLAPRQAAGRAGRPAGTCHCIQLQHSATRSWPTAPRSPRTSPSCRPRWTTSRYVPLYTAAAQRDSLLADPRRAHLAPRQAAGRAGRPAGTCHCIQLQHSATRSWPTAPRSPRTSPSCRPRWTTSRYVPLYTAAAQRDSLLADRAALTSHLAKLQAALDDQQVRATVYSCSTARLAPGRPRRAHLAPRQAAGRAGRPAGTCHCIQLQHSATRSWPTAPRSPRTSPSCRPRWTTSRYVPLYTAAAQRDSLLADRAALTSHLAKLQAALDDQQVRATVYSCSTARLAPGRPRRAHLAPRQAAGRAGRPAGTCHCIQLQHSATRSWPTAPRSPRTSPSCRPRWTTSRYVPLYTAAAQRDSLLADRAALTSHLAKLQAALDDQQVRATVYSCSTARLAPGRPRRAHLAPRQAAGRAGRPAGTCHCIQLQHSATRSWPTAPRSPRTSPSCRPRWTTSRYVPLYTAAAQRDSLLADRAALTSHLAKLQAALDDQQVRATVYSCSTARLAPGRPRRAHLAPRQAAGRAGRPAGTCHCIQLQHSATRSWPTAPRSPRTSPSCRPRWTTSRYVPLYTAAAQRDSLLADRAALTSHLAKLQAALDDQQVRATVYSCSTARLAPGRPRRAHLAPRQAAGRAGRPAGTCHCIQLQHSATRSWPTAPRSPRTSPSCRPRWTTSRYVPLYTAAAQRDSLLADRAALTSHLAKLQAALDDQQVRATVYSCSTARLAPGRPRRAHLAPRQAAGRAGRPAGTCHCIQLQHSATRSWPTAPRSPRTSPSCRPRWTTSRYVPLYTAARWTTSRYVPLYTAAAQRDSLLADRAALNLAPRQAAGRAGRPAGTCHCIQLQHSATRSWPTAPRSPRTSPSCRPRWTTSRYVPLYTAAAQRDSLLADRAALTSHLAKLQAALDDQQVRATVYSCSTARLAPGRPRRAHLAPRQAAGRAGRPAGTCHCIQLQHSATRSWPTAPRSPRTSPSCRPRWTTSRYVPLYTAAAQRDSLLADRAALTSHLAKLQAALDDQQVRATVYSCSTARLAPGRPRRAHLAPRQAAGRAGRPAGTCHCIQLQHSATRSWPTAPRSPRTSPSCRPRWTTSRYVPLYTAAAQRDSLLADRAALTSHLAKLQAALDDQQVRATVYSCSTARLAPGRPRRAHLAPRQAAGRAGRPAGTCHCIQLQHSATRSWPTAPRSPRTSPSCRPRWTTSRYVPLYTAAAQRDSLLADRAALTSHLAKLQAALDDQQVRATVYSCSTARLAPGRPRRAHLAPRQAAGRAGRPAGTCHCIQLQHSATRSWPTAPRSPRTSPSCRPALDDQQVRATVYSCSTARLAPGRPRRAHLAPRQAAGRAGTTSRYVPLYTAAAQRDSLLADRAALTSHLAKLQAALDDQQVRATVYSCSTARLAPGRPRPLTSHLAKLQAALDDQQVRATVYSCSTARLAPGRPRRAHLAPRQAAGRAGRPAGTCHCIQLQHSATRSWPTAPRSPRTSPSCRPRWTTSRYVPLYTAAAQRDSLLADRAALTSHLAKLQAALDDQQVRATVYSCSTARLAPGRPRRAHLAPRQAAGRAGRPAGTCHCIQLQHSATRSWPTAPRSPRTSPSCRPRWTTSRYVPLYTAAAQRDSLLADRAALTSHLAKLQAALDDQQVRATVYSCSNSATRSWPTAPRSPRTSPSCRPRWTTSRYVPLYTAAAQRDSLLADRAALTSHLAKLQAALDDSRYVPLYTAAAQRDSLLADRAALTSHLAKLQAALDDQQVRATVYSCSTARLAPGRPRRAHLAPRQAAGRAGRPAGTCHCIQLQHSATRSWPTAPRSPRTSPSCRPRWTTSRYVPLYTAAAQRDSLLADRAALTSHLAKLQAALDDQQSVQEQYDALLQMYGEKEEQIAELRLDLQDVTSLYKAQLDELIALKQAKR
ncbi:unnamed protein product [Arctia plantaginis]|uniref:TATA element modulatory factor 1 TATA binding domain-containing protein n=1 Tax=Arctia plantaginis TaxID=874455 RepID=A0A8S0YQM1_ARCPL|nr:unnamed protein product [Arctia plantaginis]